MIRPRASLRVFLEVAPVAVGGFEQQGGGAVRRRLGVLEDGDAVAAHVAREAPGAPLAIRALAGDLDTGRSEQVAGAGEPQAHSGEQLPLFIERHFFQELEDPAGVLLRVEGLGIGVLAVALLAGVAGLFFLDLAGVLEDERDEPPARGGAVDRSGVPFGR